MLLQVLLIVHILICMALVALILMQRSEGGVLGVGGGGSGGGMFTARGAANVLTKGTTILGIAFFTTSMALTLLSGGGQPKSVLDSLDETESTLSAPLLPDPLAEPEADTPAPAANPARIDPPAPADSPAQN